MTSSGPTHPLAPLLGLDGVPGAVAQARDALAQVHRHPANRRGWPAQAAVAGLRGARASAALDGAALVAIDTDPGPDPDVRTGVHPVLAGAVRVAQETGRLVAIWRTSPRQAMARLHTVAAADLVPAAQQVGRLGRPRPDPAVIRRLELLADLVGHPAPVPAPVLAAVVHGELLTLAPFGCADGVVARGAARLAAIATGLDQKGLGVPEVGHLRRASEYRERADGFATGEPEALAAWITFCCAQWVSGAREATSIADAAT